MSADKKDDLQAVNEPDVGMIDDDDEPEVRPVRAVRRKRSVEVDDEPSLWQKYKMYITVLSLLAVAGGAYYYWKMNAKSSSTKSEGKSASKSASVSRSRSKSSIHSHK